MGEERGGWREGKWKERKGGGWREREWERQKQVRWSIIAVQSYLLLGQWIEVNPGWTLLLPAHTCMSACTRTHRRMHTHTCIFTLLCTCTPRDVTLGRDGALRQTQKEDREIACLHCVSSLLDTTLSSVLSPINPLYLSKSLDPSISSPPLCGVSSSSKWTAVAGRTSCSFQLYWFVPLLR